ncbi:MAG: hypothetical protein JKX70_02105 [Phycisphaerales bacterium]|nr:hypothetical protein [Phycisphaerales bacterium]
MSTPIPVLGAMILVGLVVGVVYLVGLTKKWGILVPFSGMLLFGSMALPVTWNDRLNPTIWLPIQQARSQLFLVCGIMGFFVFIFQTNRLRGKPVSLSLLALMLVGLYAALLRFVHGGPVDGIMSSIFAVVTLVPLVFTSSLAMDCVDDFKSILHSILLVNIIWIGMVFAQILVNPRFVTTGNELRFVGLLSNPQHAAMLMAFFVTTALWLLLNGPRKFKLIYIGVLGINVLFLLWTGSRTGLGMTLIGVSSVLYTRAGRAILLLPFAGILTYVAFKLTIGLVGENFGFSRLTSTTNTRDVVWKNLLRIGMENPAIGVGVVDSENSENSWLYGFASYGIGMLALMFLFTFAAMIEVLKNIKLRFSLPAEHRPYLDFVTGAITMYFAGAVFEGYIISRVSASLCFIAAFAGMGAILRKNLSTTQHEQYDYFEEDYSDYADSEFADEQQE